MLQVNRLYFIDAVRAFAILMMLQGHFIDTLLAPIYRDPNSIIYQLWSYFRGITAPTFFTISGLVFAYLLLRAHNKNQDKPRIKKGLFRGFLLIGIGYGLRINIFSWLNNSFSDYFFVVDVLQCIGLSLIILVGLHIILKKHSYIFSIILFLLACSCFLTEPLYRKLSFDNFPLAIANYMTKSNGSIFTILPWFGYSAFGAFISTIFFRHVHRTRFRTMSILTFIFTGFFLIYKSSWFLMELHHITTIELFKQSAHYNYLFTRLGDVLILFSVFYALEAFLRQSIISKIGEKTLSIYVIHFILLYGSFTGFGLNHFFNKSLNLTQAIFGALLFMMTVCIIAFHYAKTNAFLYNLIRKIAKNFKNR